MIVDLHAHYPMQLDPEQNHTLAFMTSSQRKHRRDRGRAVILRLANCLANYTPRGPAVTIENLRAGKVGVALSVLIVPFDEIDLDQPYGAPPSPNYFGHLTDQIAAVETDIACNFPLEAAVVRNHRQLDAALDQNKVALIHAVEGGIYLGDNAAQVRLHVHELATMGIAYITVAHLFWRRVATNAPALPFLSDRVYEWLFCQPSSGLSDLGKAVVGAMVDERILIDVTHMSKQSIEDTFRLLNEKDPDRRVPVIASHSACRLGGLHYKYNICKEHIEAIAGRKGVIGLIACKHYMSGKKAPLRGFDESMEVIFRHINRIHEVTGSHDYAAFGSDLDGFIKPTLPGLETPRAFETVEQRLREEYGNLDAIKICSGNAMRVLNYWQGGQQPPTVLPCK